MCMCLGMTLISIFVVALIEHNVVFIAFGTQKFTTGKWVSSETCLIIFGPKSHIDVVFTET
jgi:hypothetical protein